MMSRGFSAIASTKMLSCSTTRCSQYRTLAKLSKTFVQRPPCTKGQLNHQPLQFRDHRRNITQTSRVCLKFQLPKTNFSFKNLASLLPIESVKSGVQFLAKNVSNRTMWLPAAALGLGTVVTGLAHVQGAPITHRKRVMLISRSDAVKQGEKMAKKFEGRYTASMITTDANLDSILAKIIKANPNMTEHIPGADWKIKVVKQPDIDAVSFPHGTVYIFEGLLNFATTDDQRAFLIGHEIAHVVLSHAAEIASWNNFRSNFLKLTYNAFLDLTGLSLMGQSDWLFDLLFDTATSGEYQTTIDMEADYVSLFFAMKACFNPRAGVAFYNKLAKNELEAVNACISTVARDDEEDQICAIQQLPSWKEKVFRNADRAKHIQGHLKQALQWRDAVGDCPALPSKVDKDVDAMLALLDNDSPESREITELSQDVERLVARVKRSFYLEDPRTKVLQYKLI